MKNEERKALLDRLGYDRGKREENWKNYIGCWKTIEGFFKELDPSEEKEKVYDCILKMDKLIEFLIDKILKLEAAMADLHDAVNVNSPTPDGDGGGCQNRPGSPVI